MSRVIEGVGLRVSISGGSKLTVVAYMGTAREFVVGSGTCLIISAMPAPAIQPTQRATVAFQSEPVRGLTSEIVGDARVGLLGSLLM